MVWSSPYACCKSLTGAGTLLAAAILSSSQVATLVEAKGGAAAVAEAVQVVDNAAGGGAVGVATTVSGAGGGGSSSDTTGASNLADFLLIRSNATDTGLAQVRKHESSPSLFTFGHKFWGLLRAGDYLQD